MAMEHALTKVLNNLAEDIRLFIELSIQETDSSWEEWLKVISQSAAVKCWERKNCKSRDCPAYENHDGRCWLVAGTMCGGKIWGEFAIKYKSCTQCEVYVEAVFKDPATEIYEHVLTLVHSFRLTQQKLKIMATRDYLTGLYNRHFFNEIILNEIERVKRYGDAFSIIMLDIDNFKWINDNYGHIFGDKLLKDSASIIKQSVRASDIVVRYGGDEFLIVIPEDDERECEEIMARIQWKIDAWNLTYCSADYSLAISAGHSKYTQGKEIMSVLQEADERMYKNKRGVG